MTGRGGQRGRGTNRGGRGKREWVSKPPVTQNGPLIKDHLKSIEMELEILNRRRQMIQQEHELLDREREFNLKRQYEYKQPMTSNNKPNYYHQQGNKRQAIENTLKRFNSPPRVEPWYDNNTQSKPSFASRSPSLLGIAPIHSPISPSRPVVSPIKGFRLSKPEASIRKDFNPTKVTKQRSRTSYLKKTSISAINQNQPNSSYVPTKFNEAETAIPVKEDASLILHHDVQPSLQLTGRLELALGSILKDIKKLDPINFTYLSTHAVQCKAIKQIIRERIRSVMMGKKVGHMQDIIAQYREKYPVETDAEVLKLGQDFQAYNIHNLGIMPTIDSDYIKEFFKVNLKDVLHKKVEKLLNVLNDISSASKNDESVIKMMDNIFELKDSEISECSTQVAETQFNDFSKDEETEEVKIGHAVKKGKIYLKSLEILMHKNLPSVLLKHKNIFVRMIQADEEFQIAKADILEQTIKEAVKLIAKKMDNSYKENDSYVLDSFTKENTSIAKTTETSKEIEPVTVQEATSEEIDSKQNLAPVKPLEQTLKQDFSPLVKTPTSKIMDHPYYVKVVGRPKLPERAAVYLYLEQFKPASIKKHKTIGNLLVIGFNEKEGYNKILEVGDKIIGKNTLIVKASEKVSQAPRKQTPLKDEIENPLKDESSKKNNNAIKEAPKKGENENSDKDSVDVKETDCETPDTNTTNTNSNDILNIGQDLEDQITHLLTEINTGDDDDNADTNNSSVVNDDITDTNKSIGDIDNNADTSNSKEEITENASEINIEVNKSTACDKANNDNKVQPMETVSEANEHLNSNNTKDNQENETEKLTLETGTEKENNDKPEENAKTENKDSKSYLQNSGRATPTRSSPRLALTPCTIETRRATPK